MTKKEVFEAVSEILANHEQLETAMGKEIIALVEPKKGGAKVDINDIACFDENGNVTHILDSVLKVWVPVYDENGEANFYEKPDTELGFSRFTRLAEKLRKDAIKKFNATKNAVLNDMLEDNITNEEGKQLLADAEAAKTTFELPEGFAYSETKPCE